MTEKGVAVVTGDVDRCHEEGKVGYGPVDQLCETQMHSREAAPISVWLELSVGEGIRSLGCWQEQP